MNIPSALIADFEPPKAVHPTMRPFSHPAVASQALRRFNLPARNARRNAPLPQGLALRRRVLGLIGLQLGRPRTRPPAGPFARLHRIHGRFHHLPIRAVGCREGNGQRDPLPIDHTMALRARFAAIRRIRPGFWAPRGAGTLAESIAARPQSIWSASPKAFNNAWWTFCHTPWACQSRSRRQQVIPLPQPSSWGQYSQGRPVRSTKRMPVRVARLGMRRRPPLGRGGGEGNKGLRTSHSSSGRISLAIAVLPPQSCLPDQRRFC